MKLADLDVITVGNPPPGFGGRYFLFVKVTTACGIIGWGEVYAATVGPKAMEAVIRDVFERHMERTHPRDVELMYRRVHSAGFSQRPDPTVMGAFSGLEMACWDIWGKALGQPVWALLGGRMRVRVRAYTYLYPDPAEDAGAFYASPSRAAEVADQFASQGFTAVKCDPAGPYTIHGGHQPGLADLSRSEAFCAQIREAVGDRADILFGTHGQFTPSGAIRMAERIAPFSPLWFEEPCPPDTHPDDLAQVARATSIPVASGERLTTKVEFAALLRAGAASILQPALGRVGGIWEARKIAALAESYGAQMAPHLYAGPIEFAANIHLATAIPNALIAESIGDGRGFHADLVDRPLYVEDGHVTPSIEPGLGLSVNEDVARAHPYTGDGLHLMMAEEPIRYDAARPSFGRGDG
ncbi:L-alanine-DL-glutamate epimerase-like enolase superfamily enzyme [Rubricella aquisinus]|uniref:L-alanine-DL-glutamate epimerase-like enolase superfamily enzyme n=1 Tax=Rubricella aquisinus TaxID=2028108 RepID=A0A840X0W8_9RHOB|nr:mandelate racemase/muconate lactonizing enzyme family protein [Rubricella aquisinus]MBB5515535.1 L-alanine-DL-glutamate epimerase-like enolase superfamily enzyme [Rubricella aquisinus]